MSETRVGIDVLSGSAEEDKNEMVVKRGGTR
jgi:hypothetical protein